MADLVAYRGLIEDVPEWPSTTSTYTRFILYMLIPVAFWVLGVVAEEIVGRAAFLANARSPLRQRALFIGWASWAFPKRDRQLLSLERYDFARTLPDVLAP